jgi:hypothetical protein
MSSGGTFQQFNHTLGMIGLLTSGEPTEVAKLGFSHEGNTDRSGNAAE